MAPITIRLAQPQDHEMLCSFQNSVETSKTWQMEQSFDDGSWIIRFREISLPRPVHLAYPVSVKGIRDHLLKNELTLVALEKSILVGFISLAADPGSRTARVTDLVVEPQHRRKGIATVLAIGTVDWLVERKITGMSLEMMLKNHPAINLSRKLGFSPAGFNDVYYSNGQTSVTFYRKIN
jgi:ribosomal protein S18 acetylase RimI-like enzyme